MKYSNAFVLYPQDWGEAHVTVTDGTGASIVLKVVVYQSKQTLTVGYMDVLITGGEQLTEEQLEKLREEAMATVPVKQAGGGYRMIFDNPQDSYSGTLCFYPTATETKRIFGIIVSSWKRKNTRWYLYLIATRRLLQKQMYSPL